ncbi:hypothetical protein D3C72_1124500 [compost metagenome]
MRPWSPQARGDSRSPRRITSEPSVVVTNLPMAPSGPKNCAISAGEASIFALAENGYLVASDCWNGWCTCALQILLTSTAVGCTVTA